MNQLSSNNNFWFKLARKKEGMIGLAPMAGVSDEPFRLITAKYGKPSFIYTEFIWPEAILAQAEEGLKNLIYSKKEKPIIVQIVGSNADNFYKVVPILCELGFDGIDINMGCPDKHILARGGGAALMQNPSLAQELVEKVRQSVKDWVKGKTLEDYGYPIKEINYWKEFKRKYKLKTPKVRKLLPVSLKTRIGYSKVDKEWLNFVLDSIKPDALILHVRTFKENRSGEGHWEIIKTMTAQAHKKGIIFLGNGSIKSHKEAIAKIKQLGVDGIMIARGALGNPWVFNDKIPTTKDRLKVALEQAKLYKKMFGEKKFFAMRKHLLWYTNGLDNSRELRRQLSQVNNYKECKEIIGNYIKQNFKS